MNLNFIRRQLNRWRRCYCGTLAMPGVGNYTTELGGVKHRVDGPCFLCDSRGNPL